MRRSYKIQKKCRVCGAAKFEKILDLGAMPPANAFITKKNFRRERTFPLSVQRCRSCGLFGLRHIVHPDVLFRDYPYITSASGPLARHYRALGEEIVARFITEPNDLVVEIGSNDGTLLAAVKGACRVLGIDPAERAGTIARTLGVRTLRAYFTSKLASKVRETEGPAKIIVANNVIGHVDDLADVLRGVEVLLASDGRFIFEVHWVGNLVGEGGFDQIYHEHLSYFSLDTAERALARHGLSVVDATLQPVHGTLLRIVAGRRGLTPFARVQSLRASERSRKLGHASTYRTFARSVVRAKHSLRELLEGLRADNKRIVGYGAPAKGNTLLNYIGADPSLIEYIVDTTPAKQGTYSPGAKIPIYSPGELKRRPPDYILLLAWNYADDILKRERGLRRKGVRFIIPIPQPKIVE